MINRFGLTVRKGVAYRYHTARDGIQGPAIVVKVDRICERAVFSSGESVSVDDLISGNAKVNPKKRPKRSAKQIAATRKLVALNKARRLKRNPARKIGKRVREPRGKTYVRSNKNIRRIAHANVARGSQFKVQVKRGKTWVTLGAFAFKPVAMDYGNSLAAKYRSKQFRVFWK